MATLPCGLIMLLPNDHAEYCAGLLGDLWSLKGASGGSVAAAWTSLELPGTWPCPRRNHTLAGRLLPAADCYLMPADSLLDQTGFGSGLD